MSRWMLALVVFVMALLSPPDRMTKAPEVFAPTPKRRRQQSVLQ